MAVLKSPTEREFDMPRDRDPARRAPPTRRVQGDRGAGAAAPFQGPSKRIGDILVALSPGEVCAICTDSEPPVTSPHEARSRLEIGLTRLPPSRLREIARRLDLPTANEDAAVSIVALLTDDDGAGARWREEQGWTRKDVGRDELLGGLTLGEATEAQVRLEVAFGLHIRPMLALVEHDHGLLSFPWRCWFDLERAIVPWTEGVAAETEAFKRYDPSVDYDRNRLAAGSCITIARTVADLLAGRSSRSAFQVSVATSSESVGIAGYLLRKKHEATLKEADARVAAAVQQHRAAADKVLLDAVLLLQPGLPASASVVVPPPPRPRTPSEEDDDMWLFGP